MSLLALASSTRRRTIPRLRHRSPPLRYLDYRQRYHLLIRRRLRRKPPVWSRSTLHCALHGLTTWAVTTLIVFYLLTTSIGALIGGAFTGVTSVFSGAGSTIATAATTAAPSLANSTDPLSGIEQRIREASGGTIRKHCANAAVSAIRAVLTGDQAQAEDARNRAAEALARAQTYLWTRLASR